MIKICEICGKEFEAKLKTTTKCRSCTQKLANKKREETCMKRYGVKNVMKSQKFVDKITDTMMDRYGVKRYAQTEDFKEKFPKQMKKKYGVPYYVMTEDYCNNGHFKISDINKKASKILDDYNIDYKFEYALECKTFDIGIESAKILIELNPSYTHNLSGNHWNKNGIDINYHLEKTLLAEKYDFNCINIWDWDNFENIMHQIAKNISTTNIVNISDCTITDSNKSDIIEQFFNDYDAYKLSDISEYNIIVQKNNDIQAICSFDINDKTKIIELTGFCHLDNIKFSNNYITTCINYVQNLYKDYTICTNGDFSKYNRKFYKDIGFCPISMEEPKIIWSKDVYINTSFVSDDKKLQDGWLPVPDCGIIRYQYNPTANTDITIQASDKDFSYFQDIKNKNKKTKTKICKFCGKEFIPNSNNQIYCKGPHYRTCPICGEQYLEDNTENLKRPPVACSYKCRAKKTRETSMKKYGVPVPGNNPEAREKCKKTMKEKYGIDYTWQSKDLKNKSDATLNKNYGVTNVNDSKEIVQKRSKTRSKNNTQKKLRSLQISKNQSNVLNFQEKLSTNNIIFEPDYYIDDSSYDFKIDNVLLEIDSSAISVDKNYHLYKTLLAEDNGFECIHIFDWDDKEKIVGMLKPKTKISADSCQLWRLNKEATNEFLDQYDLQGSCRNQLLCLGLVLDNEIVQVMTFGKSVYDKNHNIVIRRMCTKFGYDIIGGYNRLLNYATEYMELYSVMIYVDASKHSKSLYENLDMTFLKKNAPRKIWSKEDKYKMDYTNRIYLSKDPEFISLGKSYDDYMIDNGWDMVYDCGVYVFEY